MLKAYKLRPPYEGVLVGGSVNTGPGVSMDIVDALEKGGGEILTDNHVLQAVLDNYYGDNGLVFQSEIVAESGERTPVEVPSPSEAARAAENAPSHPVASLPAAEHGDQSQYATFSNEELRETIQERGLSVSGKSNKDQMVQALEQDDERRALAQSEGADNGS